MNITEINLSEFNKHIKDATEELRNYEFEKAYKTIINALHENPNSPEPHNLLGIWYEYNGENDLARKHYRAAYALEPTYKPASINLERVSNLFASHRTVVDFGEMIMEEIEKEEGKENEIIDK